MARPRNQKRDRDKAEIEYERECDECTFQPDISIIRSEKSTNDPNLKAKGIDKSIQRVK